MTVIRPFRFSAVATISVPSRQAWLAKARLAEDIGYTTLLIPDHLHVAVDPIVSLMAAADATSLRIGSHVFCNDFRHPIILARQAASLDLFSDGRFQFGLGCGYLVEEYRQAGIPYDSVGTRVSRFEEALQIVKAYFREEDEVTFSGQYYQIQGVKTAIKAVQKPHPPIYVGGGGKRVLSIAAREADIVGLAARNNARGLDWASARMEANVEKLEWIREAAGERFSELELSTTIFNAAVTDNPRSIANQMGNRLGLATEQVFDCSHFLVGTVEQIVEELQRRRELLGVSCIEILEPHMKTLAPVVSRLAGR